MPSIAGVMVSETTNWYVECGCGRVTPWSMTFEYVDVETAKTARGTRLIVNALVPSPWSEAMKGLVVLAELPAVAVRRGLDAAAIDAWTGIDNAPSLIHDREPIRSNWAAIVGFVARMAPRILPSELAARADAMGTLDVLAGENGVGWNARLAMIDASTETRGFPPPIAKYLGKRYGYSKDAIAGARARIVEQLDHVASKLTGDYFGGATPNAIDVYSATFLTPIAGALTETDCPGMLPPLRAAFALAAAAFGPSVPPALLEHRERMFTRHLVRPILL